MRQPPIRTIKPAWPVAARLTNAAANAIEDLEAAESHGFSTRFPLEAAHSSSPSGALGGMLFGFDTASSPAPRLSNRTSAWASLIRLHYLLGNDGSRAQARRRSAHCLTGSAARHAVIVSCAAVPARLRPVPPPPIRDDGVRASSGLAVGAASALTGVLGRTGARRSAAAHCPRCSSSWSPSASDAGLRLQPDSLNPNLAGIRDWRWMLGSALVPAALLLLAA